MMRVKTPYYIQTSILNYRDMYSAMNSTLLEMNLQCKSNYNPTVSLKTIASLINGVIGNKTIT